MFIFTKRVANGHISQELYTLMSLSASLRGLIACSSRGIYSGPQGLRLQDILPQTNHALTFNKRKVILKAPYLTTRRTLILVLCSLWHTLNTNHFRGLPVSYCSCWKDLQLDDRQWMEFMQQQQVYRILKGIKILHIGQHFGVNQTILS